MTSSLLDPVHIVAETHGGLEGLRVDVWSPRTLQHLIQPLPMAAFVVVVAVVELVAEVEEEVGETHEWVLPGLLHYYQNFSPVQTLRPQLNV